MEDMAAGAAGSGAEEAKNAPFKCKGFVASPLMNGEADISVAEDGFALASLFDSTHVPWADVMNLKFEDYAVYVQTRTGAYAFSKLGASGEPLFAHMLSAYGDKVRKCLFVSGSLAVTAKGDVSIDGTALQGVPVEVYDNCILSLPPDLSARRVPLCFVNGFKDEDFALWISTIDGKATAYSMLGYDHAPVSKAAQDAIKALREKTITQITGLDPSLPDSAASQLARLMPGGMAAPMGAVRGIAPSFADALEAKLAESRASETYKVFQEISGADAVCVGFKANDAAPAPPEAEAQTPESGADGTAGSDSAAPPAQPPDPYMLWLVAPAPSQNACAVEFAGAAEDAAATFVYRFGDDWDGFRMKLGMALEAIAFKREIIRYSDEELGKPENSDFRMTNDRNEAVRFVRGCFAGRAIHRSMDSWKAQLKGILDNS